MRETFSYRETTIQRKINCQIHKFFTKMLTLYCENLTFLNGDLPKPQNLDLDELRRMTRKKVIFIQCTKIANLQNLKDS